MRPLLTWLALLALTVVAVMTGQLVVALVIAGGKAVLVGLEFMELGQAARLHAAAWVAFIALVLGVLAFIAA